MHDAAAVAVVHGTGDLVKVTLQHNRSRNLLRAVAFSKDSVLKLRRSTYPRTLTSIGSRGPFVVSRCFLRSQVRNSNTKYSFSSWCRIFCSLTTLGWSPISLRREISLTAVLGMPSSWTSRRIFFKATSSFVILLRPL